MGVAKKFFARPFRRSAAWMAFLAAAYALRGLGADVGEIGVVLSAMGWIFGGQAFVRDLRALPGRTARLAAAGIALGTIGAAAWLRPYVALTPAQALALCAALLGAEALAASLLIGPTAPPGQSDRPADRPPPWLRDDSE